MEDDPTRRTVLTATGTAALASLAGCTADDDDGNGGDGNSTGDTNGTDETNSSDDGNGDEDESSFIDYDEDATVSFIEPTDGDTIAGGVYVSMTAENLEIEAVEEGVNDGAGHFHVLVDQPPVEEGEPIPSEDGYNHFGDGSLETVLDLDAGEHDLVLQAGDGQHRALPVTDEVTVTVETATLEFAGIEDGETVSSPVSFDLEVDGADFEIERANQIHQNAGHHHVLVDHDPVDVGEMIPSDDGYNHFGGGSSSIELELEPGDHDLVAQVGTGTHIATPLIAELSITVEE